MTCRLFHYDHKNKSLVQVGFGVDSRMLIRMAFDANPDLQDQAVLDEADKTGELMYARIDDRIIYQTSIKKLVGELNAPTE